MKAFGMEKDEKEVSEMAGERGTVQIEMEPGAEGKVELRGTQWKAVNVGEAVLVSGAACQVVKVDGLTLQVSST